MTEVVQPIAAVQPVDEAASAAPECRPAEAERAAKRARTEGPATAALVAAVLRSQAEYPSETPAAAREMIANMVEVSLAPEVEGQDPGPFHDQLMGMCRETLEDIGRATREAAEAAAHHVTAAEAAVSTKQDDKNDVEVFLQKARFVADGATEHLRSEEAAAEREEALAGAEEPIHHKSLQELSELQLIRASVGEVITDTFRPLVEGSDPRAAEDMVTTLKAFLGSIGADLTLPVPGVLVDQTLLAATRGALVREPGVRGEFDAETVKELQAVLDGRAAELDVALEIKSRSHAEVEVDVMGAQAVLHVARRRASEAASASAAAEAAVKKATTALAEAELAVAEQRKSVSLALATRVLTEHRVQEVAEASAAMAASKPNVAGA